MDPFTRSRRALVWESDSFTCGPLLIDGFVCVNAIGEALLVTAGIGVRAIDVAEFFFFIHGDLEKGDRRTTWVLGGNTCLC